MGNAMATLDRSYMQLQLTVIVINGDSGSSKDVTVPEGTDSEEFGVLNDRVIDNIELNTCSQLWGTWEDQRSGELCVVSNS